MRTAFLLYFTCFFSLTFPFEDSMRETTLFDKHIATVKSGLLNTLIPQLQDYILTTPNGCQVTYLLLKVERIMTIIVIWPAPYFKHVLKSFSHYFFLCCNNQSFQFSEFSCILLFIPLFLLYIAWKLAINNFTMTQNKRRYSYI